jgi:hypothetical protein
MIPEPIVRLAQTMRLSCIHSHCLQMDRNEIQHDPCRLGVSLGASKMIFEPGYVWRKPCTYFVSRLALSPHGLKQASTRASSPRSTIGCIQNDSWAYGTFSTNGVPILHHTNTISKSTKMKLHMTHITYKDHRVRPKWFVSLGANRAPILHWY